MKKKEKVAAQKNGNSEIEYLDIADLLPDEKNARSHTPRGVGMITDALREVGTGRSGVIDEKGKVLAGNATLEALAEAGIRRVKVVESNGEEWVVVRRTGLTAKQKKQLALYDNRTAELSSWELDVLTFLNDEDSDLLKPLWTADELDSLLGNFKPATQDEQSKLDGKTPIECPECGATFTPK